MNAILRERLFSRLVIDPSGCVLWTGATDQGYGRIQFGPQRERVHRLMWEIFNGPIPDGMQLDHLCRVRNCCSVAHLELVTSRENTLRGTGPTAVNAAKDQCDNGHEYDVRNTLFRRDGRRRCRECTLRKNWWYRTRHKTRPAGAT